MFRSGHQPDLFDTLRADDEGGYAVRLQAPPPAYFIERIRNELTVTLAKARGAVRMPWKDLTAATLAEMRFKSITRWLTGRRSPGIPR